MAFKRERVALLTERSFEMVASMIAVLKVGGSYVPIDVTYPDKRIEFIIEDAEVAAVLTYGKAISSHIPVIKIEDIDNTENNKRLNIEYAGIWKMICIIFIHLEQQESLKQYQ